MFADPCQRSREAQLGLVVTERDVKTRAARAVTCQFCLKSGREAKPGARRERLSHVQSFTTRFRCDMYKCHHKTTHPDRSAKFQQLTTAERSSYLDKVVNHTNTLFAHFDGHRAMTLTFNRDIVEKLIGYQLFDIDDKSVHTTRACARFIFKLHEKALPKDRVEMFFVKIKSVLRFNMVLGFVSK